MEILADLHTHSIASGHAYSTIQEMVMFAKIKNIKILAITEHGYSMPDACHENYYYNLASIPREIYGVHLLLGCEANILDYSGHIDLCDAAASQLDEFSKDPEAYKNYRSADELTEIVPHHYLKENPVLIVDDGAEEPYEVLNKFLLNKLDPRQFGRKTLCSSDYTQIGLAHTSREGDNYVSMMKDHRTKGFSPLIKRRFIIGSYVLQKENQERYFKNAQRVRRLIVDTWKELYKKYDAVVCPVGIGPAKKFEDLDKPLVINTMTLDEHLQVGNFGGFPSITIPDGFVSDVPVGINITGNCYDDENVLNIAYALEGAMEYKNQIAKEVKHD